MTGLTEDQSRQIQTLARAIAQTSKSDRALSVLTFDYPHGSGSQTVAVNYSNNDAGEQLASDLIRALVTLFPQHEIRVFFDNNEVEVGRPIKKWVADLIWGKDGGDKTR